MAFDSISIVMFLLIFVVGFVFSLLGITDLVYSAEKKKSPWLGLIGSALAATVWMSFTLIWVAGSTLEMFVAFGSLWLALMFIFITLAIASAVLILRSSVKPEEEPTLQIKERA